MIKYIKLKILVWLVKIYMNKFSLKWYKIYRFLFERKWRKVDKLPHFLRIEDIEECIKMFKWKADKWYFLGDYISYPSKVYLNMTDDCDGAAVLSASLLKKTGFKPLMIRIAVKPIQRSHVICIFKQDKKIGVFDNGRLDYFDTIFQAMNRNVVKLGMLLYWDCIDLDLKQIVSSMEVDYKCNEILKYLEK